MSKTVTILDVARESGLSKSAVAYALNGDHAGKVAPEKVDKALTAARKLGYSPNHMAKTLRSRRSGCVGVMLPHPTDHFYGELILELQRFIWERDYVAFFSFWDTPRASSAIRKNYDTLMSWNVEGIITCELPGAFPDDPEVPFVFYQSKPFRNCDVVNGDYSVMFDAMTMLRDKGHERFALIAPNHDSSRSNAFHESLKRLDLPRNPDWNFLGRAWNRREFAKQAMNDCLALKERPTAVFCHNDVIAISAMNEARRQGVEVPGEMAFVGINDEPEAAYANPPLTTLRLSAAEVAERLADLLFKRIKSPKRPMEEISIKPKLIIREST